MDLQQRISKELQNRKMTREDISTKYKISDTDARTILDSFGSQLRYDNGQYWVNFSTTPDYTSNLKHVKIEKDEKVGMCGDTHMCSKYHTLASLNEYYDALADAGVKTVFHAGDLTDGYLVYKGQLDDLIVWGEPNQREFVVRNYPKKKGMTTYVIAGNHDLHGFELGGSNIVENICKERTDLKYCGMYHARFLLNGSDSPKLDVVHDTHKRAYALCFDEETEILTKTGFKRFNELTDDDIVATLNDREEFEWQLPTERQRFEWDDDLIRINARCVDLLITPNHDLLVRRYPGKINRLESLKMPQKSHKKVKTEWFKIDAQTLLDGYVRQKWQMKRDCKWVGNDIQIVEADKEYPIIPFLKFIGWYVSEGCSNQSAISIFQSPSANPENHEEIKQCLLELGMRIMPQKRKDEIRFYNKKLVGWLKNNCGGDSYTKKVPEFIKELSPHLIKTFLETYLRGDGWHYGEDNPGFVTASRKLSDDINECLLKVGWVGTTTKRQEYMLGKKGSICYHTCISIEQFKPTINTIPQKIHYRGYVYDVTVPNHLIFVRRNGRIIITGNSYPSQVRQRDTPPSDRPDISLAGHRHITFYTYYNNEHMFEAGCFEKSSPYMRGRGIQATIAGWITELDIKDEFIKRCKPELLVF